MTITMQSVTVDENKAIDSARRELALKYAARGRQLTNKASEVITFVSLVHGR